MNVSVQTVKILTIATAAALAAPLLTVDAMAAKEKFERTKPHVNVGTIGNGGSSENPNNLATPQGGNAADGNSSTSGDCKPRQAGSSAQAAC